MQGISDITAGDMQATGSEGETRRTLMAHGTKAKSLAAKGRMGDTEMAHVTPGEIVVPISAQTPEVLAVLQGAFEEIGVPMERYTVGEEENSINPETGIQEHGFLSKIAKIAVPAITGYMTGGPLGAVAGGLSGLAGGDAGAGGMMAGGGGQGGGGGGSSMNLPSTTTAAVMTGSKGPAVPGAFDSVTPIDDVGQQDPSMSQGGPGAGSGTQFTQATAPTASIGSSGGGTDTIATLTSALKQILSGINGTGLPEFFDVNSPSGAQMRPYGSMA